MQSLTIHAATAYSAQALAAALSQFDSKAIEANGNYEVTVTLGRSDREIVDVLNALEVYVTELANGPAQIEFEGREYTLHADPSSVGMPSSGTSNPG
jgi:hypothetical protein